MAHPVAEWNFGLFGDDDDDHDDLFGDRDVVGAGGNADLAPLAPIKTFFELALPRGPILSSAAVAAATASVPPGAPLSLRAGQSAAGTVGSRDLVSTSSGWVWAPTRAPASRRPLRTSSLSGAPTELSAYVTTRKVSCVSHSTCWSRNAGGSSGLAQTASE
ncbi:hypothetical protein B0T26DRAFT_218034 [Lasiosphaeria miniovina]|uniref:Uncharacterized protein n=1 Tax=Lasiosphaeria miniovina TaxID=1954250 RepID=A0AA40E2C6_9PEZI|nr:uncharacterized protein B0T26DRAFT_218034 [Lasiosphaeria miniovina]KAK0722407.1 hypothetical protein B0T26DRAFT_218034 [Lasiosphaeria miniovina]